MAHMNKQTTITRRFGVMDKIVMHPQTGVPIIFHDQLNVISQHLASIKLDEAAKMRNTNDILTLSSHKYMLLNLKRNELSLHAKS